MFCTFTLALSVVCLQCPHMAVFFCTFLISCFPGMLLSYCLSDFVMVPVAPIITGITFAFTIHISWIYIMRSLYFKIFSASFLITFLSPGTAASITMHIPFLLSWIMIPGLLLEIVLSVRTCWFHNMLTLPSWLVSTDFGKWPYQYWLSNFTPILLLLVVVVALLLIFAIKPTIRLLWGLLYAN